ncbi:hypothetical protein ES703_04635 [subsurface metagenome]
MVSFVEAILLPVLPASLLMPFWTLLALIAKVTGKSRVSATACGENSTVPVNERAGFAPSERITFCANRLARGSILIPASLSAPSNWKSKAETSSASLAIPMIIAVMSVPFSTALSPWEL